MRNNPQVPLKQVMERREPIHPRLPEVRQRHVRHDNATEGDDEGEEGGHEQGGEDLVRSHRGDELAHANVEQLEEHEE